MLLSADRNNPILPCSLRFMDRGSTRKADVQERPDLANMARTQSPEVIDLVGKWHKGNQRASNGAPMGVINPYGL